MLKWMTFFAADELKNGERRVVTFRNTGVIVVKHEDQFFAFEDMCTHDGDKISSGDFENGEMICPRHRARFCIKTGCVKSPPASEAIKCFNIRVKNGHIQIKNP